MGFRHVEAGRCVRSSYHAGEQARAALAGAGAGARPAPQHYVIRPSAKAHETEAADA